MDANYYYSLARGGEVRYYSRLTGAEVAATSLPDSVRASILPLSPGVIAARSTRDLLRDKAALVSDIAALNRRIAQIDRSVVRLACPNHEALLQADAAHIATLRERANRVSHPDVLSQVGISTRPDYRQWLLIHHPDKGGKHDVDLFARVLAAAKAQGW